MGESEKGDPVYSIEEWGDGRVVTVSILAKYLNYDISDGLKLRLRDSIQGHLDGGVQFFVLDLSKVSIVDSCGVGLMIGIHNLIRDREATLYLTGITHFLEKIFRMMHLDQYFHVVKSTEEVRELAATSA